MASKYIAGVGTDIENSCSLLEPPDILTAYCGDHDICANIFFIIQIPYHKWYSYTSGIPF